MCRGNLSLEQLLAASRAVSKDAKIMTAARNMALIAQRFSNRQEQTLTDKNIKTG